MILSPEEFDSHVEDEAIYCKDCDDIVSSYGDGSTSCPECESDSVYSVVEAKSKGLIKLESADFDLDDEDEDKDDDDDLEEFDEDEDDDYYADDEDLDDEDDEDYDDEDDK